MKQFDVVIAGGAMTGATLAIALDKLSSQGLSVAVVEAVAPQLDQHPGFDSRAIALSYGSSEILQQLGMWAEIAPVATAIKDIHVSDRGHAGRVDMSAQEQGVDALGYVVELADIGQIFHHKLAQLSSVTLYCPDSVAEIERDVQGCTITLSSGQQLRTQLLVAADGALSHCCDMVHIGRTEHDFDQLAVIANITTEQAHQGQAFERFTEFGPIALLPMSQGRSSLVWCINPEQQHQVMSWSDDDFLSQLQAAFGWRLGKLQHTGKRACYPLLLRQSGQITSHRVAVVGNAAQTLHPIAGQGFNLGIRDVISLAEEVAYQYRHHHDVGSQSVLSCYRQRRENDRQQTVMMTTGLVHLFANHYAPLVVGRNLGLMAMNVFHSLQAPLLRRAMGQVER
ncbi:TPA: 2-octaprenyl-6-methoxyphenyl hydroxylase [Photobacterium damselae]